MPHVGLTFILLITIRMFKVCLSVQKLFLTPCLSTNMGRVVVNSTGVLGMLCPDIITLLKR